MSNQKYVSRKDFPPYSLEYVVEMLENIANEHGATWKLTDYAQPHWWYGRGTAWSYRYTITTRRFVQKLTACQLFGLIDRSGDTFSLTSLATQILSHQSPVPFYPSDEEGTLSLQKSFLRIAPFQALLQLIQREIGMRGFDLEELEPFASTQIGVAKRAVKKFLRVFFVSAYFAQLLTTGPKEPEEEFSEEVIFLYVRGYHDREQQTPEWLEPRKAD